MCLWDCFKRRRASPQNPKITYEIMSEEANQDKNEQALSNRESVVISEPGDASLGQEPQHQVSLYIPTNPPQKRVLLRPPSQYNPQQYRPSAAVVHISQAFTFASKDCLTPGEQEKIKQDTNEEQLLMRQQQLGSEQQIAIGLQQFGQDYLLEGKEGLAFQSLKNVQLIKKIGQINHNNFSIGDCKNCRLYLLDKIAACSIADCEDCLIFVGPSVQLKVQNCKNCTIISISSRFYIKRSTKCQLYLHVEQRPVIQHCQNLQFLCHCKDSFEEVLGLMQDLNLNTVNNRWSEALDNSQKKDSFKLGYKPGEPDLQDIFDQAGLTPCQDVFLQTTGLLDRQISYTSTLVFTDPSQLPELTRRLNESDLTVINAWLTGQTVRVRVGGGESLQQVASQQLEGLNFEWEQAKN